MNTTVSGATGTICQNSGLYKATDRKAQYLLLYAQGDLFLNFPGGKGNKATTWYLVTGTTTSKNVSDSDGVVSGTGDGGFTSVVVDAGAA
jgi:hypothetical protein